MPKTVATFDVSTGMDALSPCTRTWFTEALETPTKIQRLAWPGLATGGHLLLSAPTGTGKTLAATLPLLGRLILDPSDLSPGVGQGVRCLYLTPLRALVQDACRAFRGHLEGLA